MISVLIAMAVTLPPSAAVVACYWLTLQRTTAERLNSDNQLALDTATGMLTLHEAAITILREELAQHTLNLSQLNERL